MFVPGPGFLQIKGPKIKVPDPKPRGGHDLLKAKPLIKPSSANTEMVNLKVKK